MKIFHGNRKKKPITRQLYRLKDCYESAADFKSKISSELRDQDNVSDFDFGFYEGRQSVKRWINEDEDLRQMYIRYKNCEIHLWCELYYDVALDEPPPKRRKDADISVGSRRQDKENLVDKAFNELSEKHKDAYTKPQLKLWARMIANDIHESYDLPPNVHMLTGIRQPKKAETMTEVIAGAAAAVVKAIKPLSPAPCVERTTNRNPVSLPSPGKSADTRMKNY